MRNRKLAAYVCATAAALFATPATVAALDCWVCRDGICFLAGWGQQGRTYCMDDWSTGNCIFGPSNYCTGDPTFAVSGDGSLHDSRDRLPHSVLAAPLADAAQEREMGLCYRATPHAVMLRSASETRGATAVIRLG